MCYTSLSLGKEQLALIRLEKIIGSSCNTLLFKQHSLGFIAYFLSDIFISIRYNRNEIKKEGDK